MRTMLSFLCGIVALVAGLVTMPVAWVAHNVASEDGYVSFAEPLARDTTFQRDLLNAVSSNLIARAGIPAQAQGPTATVLAAATTRIAGAPGFVEAWNATGRQSHRIMFGDPRTLPADLDANDRLAIDLGPLGQFVAEQVNASLPVRITAPKQLVVPVGGNAMAGQLDRIARTPTYEREGVVVTAILVVLCLVLARRRSLATALLGAGSVVLALVLHVIAGALIPEIVKRNTAPSSFAKAALDAFSRHGTSSFDHWLVVLGVVGAIVVIGASAARLAFSVRSRA